MGIGWGGGPRFWVFPIEILFNLEKVVEVPQVEITPHRPPPSALSEVQIRVHFNSAGGKKTSVTSRSSQKFKMFGLL